MPRSSLDLGAAAETRCDSRRFRLPLTAQTSRTTSLALQARTEDGSGESHWVDVADASGDAGVRTVVLELRPVCGVRARAVDASGAVVPQAEWMIWSFPGRVASWDAATSEGERQFIRSGEDGEVRFRPRAGRLVAFVRTPDGAFGEPTRVDVEPPQELDLGDVAVGPALAEIRVRVTDRNGVPISGAAVLLPVEERAQRYAGDDAGPRPHEAAQETDGRGEVVVRAARSGVPLAVAVCAEGFVPSLGLLDRSGARDREFRLRASPALRVRFRAGAGFEPVPEDVQVEPPPDAELRFDVHPETAGALGDDAAALLRDVLSFHGRFRGKADGEGTLAGHVQHSGRWRISARFPGGLLWRGEFEAADGVVTELVVELPAGRVVTIPLPANAEERNAIRAQNVRVQLPRLSARSSGASNATSNATAGDRWDVTNATLRLAELPGDGPSQVFWAPDACEAVTVSWSRRGGWLGRASVPIPSGPGAALALPFAQILAPPQGACRVRVRAVLEAGAVPIPSLEVAATAIAETREETLGERTRCGASGTTDAEGFVEFTLAPGRYRVRISPASGPGMPVEVDVRDAERPTEVVVTMPLRPR